MPRDRERWRKGKRVGDKRLLFTHIHLRSSAKKVVNWWSPSGVFRGFSEMLILFWIVLIVILFTEYIQYVQDLFLTFLFIFNLFLSLLTIRDFQFYRFFFDLLKFC